MEKPKYTHSYWNSTNSCWEATMRAEADSGEKREQ